MDEGIGGKLDIFMEKKKFLAENKVLRRKKTKNYRLLTVSSFKFQSISKKVQFRFVSLKKFSFLIQYQFELVSVK